MTPREFDSMGRVVAAIEHREADRVPLFLLLTITGAREVGMSIRDYFSRPESVAEAQLRMRERYGHDCVYTFHYAALELEAWGGDAVFFDDGPPNAGSPVVSDPFEIAALEPPRIAESAGLCRVLRATEMLKARLQGRAPVVGVVMSPFSLPVMQMGFDRYIELIYERPKLFERLMAVNEEFCVEWANAQFAAGATFLAYFDPLASPDLIDRPLYLKTGHLTAQRTIARLHGPAVMHLASGRCSAILPDIQATGAGGVAVSALDDLSAVKRQCAGKLAVVGNLNGIEMCRWSPVEAEAAVKAAIAAAGRGGGFILADHHGEIPWSVSDAVLQSISGAVDRWGRYPLDWVDDYAG